MNKLAYKNRVLLLVFMALSLSLLGNQVFADTDTPISSTSPTPNSANYTGTGNNFTPYTGVGVGGFEGKVSWAKVYVPMGRTTTITIEQNCGISIGSPKVNFRLRDLSDLEKDNTGNFPLRPYLKTATRGSSDCSDVVFDINSKDYGIASSRSGHGNYRVFYLRAEMANGVSGSSERYFRFKANNGALIGLASPIDFADIDPGDQYFSVYNGSGTWDYSVRFGPRCDVSAGNHTGTIKIKDPDNGIYQNNMNAIVQRSDRGRVNPNWSNPGPNPFYSASAQEVQGSPWGASNTIGSFSLNINKLYVYKLTIRGSSYPNTIQVQLPFDQFDGNPSDVDCSEGWRVDTSSKMNYSQVKFDYTQANKPGGSPPTSPTYNYGTSGMNCNSRYPAGAKRTSCQNWNAYYNTLKANTSNAMAAFKRVRTTHSVGNVGDNGQKEWVNATPGITTSYRFIRFNGNEDDYAARYNGATSTMNIPKRDWQDTPRSPDMPAVSSTQRYAKRILGTDTGINENGYTGGDPRPDDKYCERIYASPSSQPGSGTATSYDCVSLKADADVCNGQPWNIIASAQTRKTGGGGGGYIDSAWVGDSYAFRYTFEKNGPAKRTSTINFRHIAYDVNPGGPDFTWSNVLGSESNDRRNITIQPSDGGRTFKDNVDWAPNSGTYDNADNKECTATDNGQVWAQDVAVPFYYNLQPSVQVSGDKIEQGNPVSSTGSIYGDNNGANVGTKPQLNNPAVSADANGGRQTTWSRPTQYQIIGRVYAPNNGPQVAEKRSSAQTSVIKNGENKAVDNAGEATFTDADTAAMEVGSKVCYSLAVLNPTHFDTGWYETPQVCATIKKSPKIHFENTDVQVGQGIPKTADDNNCSPNGNAMIKATGVPQYIVNHPGGNDPNVYGSWVEYGAFATGSVSQFGSAAFSTGSIPGSDPTKLTFGNVSTPAGRYVYPVGSQCTFNWFTNVLKGKTIEEKNSATDVDLAASSGKTIQVNGNNATIPSTVASTPTGVQVAVYAAGDQYRGGKPQVKLRYQRADSGLIESPAQFVDAPYQGEGSATQWSKLVFDIGPGTLQKLELTYPNDAFGNDGDQNLIIQKIEISSVGKATVTRTLNYSELGGSHTRGNYVMLPNQAPNNNCVPTYAQGGTTGSFKVWQGENTQDGGSYCYGLQLNNINYESGVVTNPDPTPVQPGYGSDTIVYAKANGGNCGSGGGMIYINKDIQYPPEYDSIDQLPRIILMAQCGIVISKNVSTIDAWLVTGGTLTTCDATEAGQQLVNKNPRDAGVLTKDDCSKRLITNGAVVAKQINLWRTYGADLRGTTGPANAAAENLNVRPDQLLSTYSKGVHQGNFTPVYEISLPPRY